MLSAVITATSMMSIASANAADFTESTPRYHPNTGDTDWSVGHDYCRVKEDSSSVYVKNVSLLYTAKVSVYGADYVNGTLVNYTVNGQNFSALNLTLPVNCERQIRQNVWEYGHTYAHIYFANPGSGYNSSCGKWSPDCYGTSYTYLNCKRQIPPRLP